MSAPTTVRPVAAGPGFGRAFTAHTVSMTWSRETGWTPPVTEPYGPLLIDPAMVGLHYGQVIFEGLKAYRQPDGTVAVFRPADNAARFAASARRLAMPELPAERFLTAVDQYLRADGDAVPSAPGQSLYLRPVMFATDADLALKPAETYRFILLGFATETFFDPSLPAVSVWAGDRYVRAAPGGTGEAKCAGNYAGALIAQVEAAEHGCQQVLWLDSRERRWVEEMGGMNVFFVYGDTVVTPPLTGTLLPGLTRASVLSLAADLGLAVDERPLSIEELRADCESGAITEGFACGTAAVIVPIGTVKRPAAAWTVGTGASGPVTTALRERLTAIQYGRHPDVHGWMRQVTGERR